MPWRASWRSSPAIYCAPLLVALLLYQLQVAVPWRFDPTWLAAFSRPAAGLFLIATATAGCAAWDASRMRRARLSGWTPVRSPIEFLLVASVPALCLGMLAVASALATALPQTFGAPGWPDARPLLAVVVAVAGHTLVGTAFGWLMPVYASIPVVLVGTYLWQVYPAAMEPVWLRHLTGYGWEYCCNEWAVPDTGLVWASLAAPAGLAVAALLLFGYRRMLLRGVAAVVASGGMITVAALVAAPLAADPTVPRAGAMVCEEGEPTVCVWPENRMVLPRVSAQAARIAHDLEAVGMAVPSLVSERSAAAGPDDWTFVADQDAEGEQVRRVLVHGLVPQMPDCVEQGVLPEATSRTQQAAWGWLWAITGGDPGEFPHPDPTGQRSETVDAVRALPEPEQVDWYHEAREAVLDCAAAPDLAPAS